MSAARLSTHNMPLSADASPLTDAPLSCVDAALETGWRAILREPAPSPDPEGVWARVNGRLTRQRRLAAYHPLTVALIPTVAAAVVCGWLLLPQRPVHISSAEVMWVAKNDNQETWIDDPAGRGETNLWSTLSLDARSVSDR